MKTRAQIIGENIAARRKAMGLSKAALARNAKTSFDSVFRWEKGIQEPHDLASVAGALKCSEAELLQPRDAGVPVLSKTQFEEIKVAVIALARALGLSIDPKKAPANELLSRFEKLSKKDQAHILSVLRQVERSRKKP